MLRRALFSVADKNGLVEFASQLTACSIDIIATGGTAICLQHADIPVTEVSQYTGFPEIMQGRVKTLHPKIHGALLARPGIDDEVLQQLDIPPIELVVVNLYPFANTIAQADCTFDQALEQIDIGGTTMVRAAAKNHASVTIIVDPDDYPLVLKEITQYGNTTSKTRLYLAVKAFAYTADYETTIAEYFKQQIHPEVNKLPEKLLLNYRKDYNLRYGENPHQGAALYIPTSPSAIQTSPTLLQGKALSFNNMIDSESAMRCVLSLDPQQAACVIVKHATPCGAAQADSLVAAYQQAYATDPSSAFGGIIACNQTVTAAIAAHILEQQFVEVIIAPDFSTDALQYCQRNANLRLLSFNKASLQQPAISIHSVAAGLLVQEVDTATIQAHQLRVVTKRSPSPDEIKDLLFAWQIVNYVKSNAIVCAKNQTTIGIGGGQTSRVFSVHIALTKAQQAKLNLHHAVMASDAFFPFADGVQLAATAGISAIIQPGGSKRDGEVIAAADSANIAMVFTDIRHFRH